MKFELEGKIDWDTSVSGAALVASLHDLDSHMFVEIRSFDHNKNHHEARKFEGKKVRVTIEEIE